MINPSILFIWFGFLLLLLFFLHIGRLENVFILRECGLILSCGSRGNSRVNGNVLFYVCAKANCAATHGELRYENRVDVGLEKQELLCTRIAFTVAKGSKNDERSQNKTQEAAVGRNPLRGRGGGGYTLGREQRNKHFSSGFA